MNDKKLKLKGRMVTYGLGLTDIASMIGISLAALSNKGNDRAPFLFREALAISKILEINPNEMEDYFL